ncbi:GTP 3',8-cyclase MoaA [Agitococcus lubricus]|uniref:GTP 3',8-cyclase n=1 Tax=Agitococcus lubricus TaxID=1077255 RepID=A0A2T5IVM4_9GAMM|nr:GTP 3',8-cyclase MoaA [Agitococcus lubricus]PTQ87861.1 cyclic pyranopterin monophosphate synthase subunit MoaA [Agitococcus lubricus]
MALIDGFGREITYVRLSVTDRCDFRCVYCMSEDMQFLPRAQVLSLEEIYRIGRILVALGVTKIRLTGGEPLIRQNIVWLVTELAQLEGLKELTLTTNGSRLSQLAAPLKAAGLSRINISLDSLQTKRFKDITRTGDLADVLAGIQAAQDAGFKRIKLNTVIMRGYNEDEVLDLVNFVRQQQLDIAFIEEMPLGQIDDHTRQQTYMSSDELRAQISTVYPLHAVTDSTGGPARYYAMSDSLSRIGFISPHSHNFCGDCNRVRVTVEGRLLLCLGNEHSIDLKAVLRASPDDDKAVIEAIHAALAHKPERHYFDLANEPQIVRFMNMTGG